MTAFKIVVEDKPDEGSRKAIVALLQEYNWSKVDKPTVEHFSVSLRDPESDEVIGGLWADVYGGWFYIATVIVPEALRGRGIGSSLMTHAEEAARMRGCIGIWLDTHTFQAPAFYEKLGYREMGKLTDFPKGHDRVFYFKKIDT